MKRSLLVLPLVALILAGCTSGGGKKSKKTSKGGGESSDGIPALDPLDFGADEYEGWKRCKKAPENDKEYLMGFWHIGQQKFRFINNLPHVDAGKEYPFYLATTENPSEATKVKIHYASDKVHYSIQVMPGGQGDYYSNKYLEIYEGAKSSGALITTIRHVDSPVEQFHYEEVCADFRVQTSVIDIQGTRPDHSKGIFACSGEDYQTVSGIDEYNFGNGYICHFWEQK